MVRLAFVASVAWAEPPVSLQRSHVSGVPNASAPPRALDLRPGAFRRIHSTLVAEKYGSTLRPVMRAMAGSFPARRNDAQRPAVRRSCQTIAGATVLELLRSQTSVVSRWLVSPIAATDARAPPRGRSASRRAPIVASQISSPP